MHDESELANTPVCGVCCQALTDEHKTPIVVLCSPCYGYFWLGVERQVRIGVVPGIDRPRAARRPGQRLCRCCWHPYRQVSDERMCLPCVQVVQFGRDLVQTLAAIELN